MNNMRKVLCFLMAAMMLAAFALPSNAAAPKQFSVDGLPTSTSQTVTLIFTNQTPVGGVSTINSLRLIAPTGWSLSNPVAIPGGNVSGGTPVETGPATVAFVNIPGIKAGGNTWWMQVTVTASTASAPCSNGWGAQAFAGNSLNGDQFLLINTPASLNVGKIINASAGAGGTITPSGAVSVSCGANKTFTIAPTTGYHIADVLVDGTSVGAVASYTFTNVTVGHTIAASFAINTYTIGGTVTGLGSGKSVVLQNNGGNDLPVSANGSFTFTVNYGGSYVVTVLTQPTGQTCTVTSGSGTNVTANVTGVGVNCTTNTLTIHVPSTATLNTPFTVTVDLIPPGNASVTLSSNDCTLTPASQVPTATTPDLVTFTVTITAAPSFACTITASAGSAYSSSTATISPIFTTGVLGCGDPPDNNKAGNLVVNNDPPLAYIGPPDWGLERSLNNKDHSGCTIAVPFEFQFDPTNNTAAFIIPNTLGQKVAVEYVLLWRAILTDGGPVNPNPSLPYANVAWLRDNANPTLWKFVPALACVEDDVDLGLAPSGDQPVMPIIPSIEPFIFLGGNGYPGYAPGQVALVCIGQEGWTAIGRDDVVGSPTFGQKLRQYWHKVIDYGDAAIKLP